MSRHLPAEDMNSIVDHVALDCMCCALNVDVLAVEFVELHPISLMENAAP